MIKYEWKSIEILMNWVPNWRLNLSQTGGWKKNGDCGSNIKQKLVSAVDTDSLCVWLANDVPNTSGFMQFFRKIRLQSQIRPFLGVRSTNPLSRASGLGKLTRTEPGSLHQKAQISSPGIPRHPANLWISSGGRYLDWLCTDCWGHQK